MKSLEQREFDYLVTSPRKTPKLMAKTLAKVAINTGQLITEGRKPFYMQEAIYEGCKKISEYVHDEGIGHVVLVDKSARPLWKGISTYWKLAYPQEQQPDMHFLNPALFRAYIRDSKTSREMSDGIRSAGVKCKEELEESNSSLAEEVDEPILLADACLHSGRAAYLTKRVLEEADFADIRLGVIKSTLPKGGLISPDIYGTDSAIAARCIRSVPNSGLVVNDEASIYSRAQYTSETIENATSIRREIGSIVAERFLQESAELSEL